MGNRRRRVWSLIVSGLLLAALAGRGSSSGAGDVAGHWEGAIEIPGVKLGVAIELKLEGGVWTGSIDIPMQGARGLPLGGIAVTDSTVTFRLPGVPGDPTFDGRLADGKLAGTFRQAGQQFPFALGREAVAEAQPPKRPQEPKPPFPYRIEEVTYAGGRGVDGRPVTLAGTLTIPEGEGPFPAALLVTGSGAQNRDEELLGHKPFAVLADALTRRGIMVLRVDDRGVGGSSGSTRMSTTADFAQDAVAGVRWLRGRAQADRKRVGIVGHSEGAIVGPLAASLSKDVRFLVMLAGTGVPGGEVVLAQSDAIGRAGGASEADLKQQRQLQEEAFAMLRAGADSAAIVERGRELARLQAAALPDSLRPSAEQTEVVIVQQTASMTAPWFRYFLDYDPRPALRKVKVPVLVLNGERDLQVLPDQNLPEIEAALRKAGNRQVTVHRLPELNHLFQHAQLGAETEYGQIEETMAPQVLQLVADWILARKR